MLTRFRRILSKIYLPIAKMVAETGIPPNTITLSSLLFGFLAFLSIYLYSSVLLYLLFILLMGLMDVLDGAVARLTGRVSGFGAFLDSTTDRVNDAFLIYALKYMGVRDEVVVSLLVASLLISYTRARGESLGVKMEGVGMVERAERILVLAAAAVAYPFSTLASRAIAYLLLALSLVTLLQRILHVHRMLGKD